MSIHKPFQPSQKKSSNPHYKLRTPTPISSSTCLSPFHQAPQASCKSLSQKENTVTNVFQKPNSVLSPNLSKPLVQQSCKSLRPTLNPQFEAFKVQPNSVRSHTLSKLNHFVSSTSETTKKASATKKTPETVYKDHLFQTFQAMKFIRTLPQPEAHEIEAKKLWLPKRKGYEEKRTIVFDLDETLVHCVENPAQGDFEINIQFGTGQTMKAGVNIRPFAREVLAAANRDFEVMIFTASHRCYADEVMDYLDPTGELIHHRLYRDSCIQKNGVFIKDLRILANRNLDSVVIVDNSAYCFAYQLENGIPIISWFDDGNDRELYKLVEYIRILAQATDIAAVNRHTFKLSSFYTDYIRDFLRFQDREI
jgi:Dullard-like phosphatase family protein